jgi:hypothetical protein
MSDFQFQVGDKVRLEGTVTSVYFEGEVEVDGRPRNKDGFTLVERPKPKRPVRNGDAVHLGPVYRFKNGDAVHLGPVYRFEGTYIGRSPGGRTAVVRSEKHRHLYDGFPMSVITHTDGTEIDWDNS